MAKRHDRKKVGEITAKVQELGLSCKDTSVPLGERIRDIGKPTTYKDRRARGLRPRSEQDPAPFSAVSRGAFCVNGFRNRDLQSQLFAGDPATPEKKRRRSARVTRLLRLLRAHHLWRASRKSRDSSPPAST